MDKASNIRVLLLLATIAGLAYAFIRAQSVDFDQLASLRSSLDTLRQLEQTVDRDTLKIRVGLPSNDTSLMRLTNRMTALVRSLRQGVDASTEFAPTGLANALKDYSSLLEKRKNLLQRFSTRNATVRDSLRSFPALADELTRLTEDRSGNLKQALEAFELAVLRYHIEASDRHVGNIGWSVGHLRRAMKSAPPAIATKIEALLRHGEVIVAHRAEADWTLKELLTMSGSKLLDGILSVFEKNEAALRADSNAFRSIMFVTALILVGYIVLTLASLMQVRRDLQRANSELERRILDISRAKEEAELANRSKSEFLAMMSHELRTPLNAVIGFSDLMRIEAFGPVGSDRYREYAGDIHDSARHLLSLINDILDLSKIERGSLKPEDEVLEVATAVSAVETLVKDRAERGKVTLQIRLPEALPALKADPRQLKQMLANLLTNAIKFTDPGGSVTVEVRQDAKKGYRFDVTDTGVGLAPEDIPKALAPFVQVERGHGHKHEGTGLGLPLTKRMIELHGGRLELASEFGVGTRVALIFPPSRIVAVDASNSGPAGAEEGNGRGGSVERMAGGSNPRQEPAHPA